VLDRETQMPVDIIYDMHKERRTYDGYVDLIEERLRDAYTDVRTSLKKAVETQKKYYDLSVKPTI